MRENARRHAVTRLGAPLRLLIVLLVLGWAVAPGLTSAAAVLPTAGWTFHLSQCDSTGGLGFGEFIPGPGVPPLGNGSFQFSIAEGNPLPELQQSAYDGIRLADLTALSYSTFIPSSGTHDVGPFILLDVDLNGDGGVDDQLVFQPGLQGKLPGHSWQSWNAMTGPWYSRQGLGGIGQATPGTLHDYVVANPSAAVADTAGGGFRFAAGCIGSGWEGFAGSIDAVTIGVGTTSMVYDFEHDGVHTSASGGNQMAGLAVFDTLTPSPFSTVAPGAVRIAAVAHADSAITKFTMTLNGKALDVEVGGKDSQNQTAFTEQTLKAGIYTATATATTASGDFTAEWDFIVSSNLSDGEWFTASGQPKADQINATMRSLVEAFRWHLYGQSWDGKAHPEMPTHASSVSQAAALETWVNGTTFNRGATEATLKSLVEAFRWHFWGISWDNRAHPEIPTHASTVLPPQGIDPWFTADGTPIPQNINATMKSLVEAFRWHFWGNSWDGQQHFGDMPTHKPH